MSLTDLSLHRSLARIVQEGVSHVNELHPLHPDAQNVLIGSIVVAMFAWVEENAHPNWALLHDSNQAKPFLWVSWDEFINMHKIRHCFAHSMDGTMLPNYATDIQVFLQKLLNGSVQKERLDGISETVKPYYSVTGNKITLSPSIIPRCMQLTTKYWSKATNTPLK